MNFLLTSGKDKLTNEEIISNCCRLYLINKDINTQQQIIIVIINLQTRMATFDTSPQNIKFAEKNMIDDSLKEYYRLKSHFLMFVYDPKNRVFQWIVRNRLDITEVSKLTKIMDRSIQLN